MMLAEETIHDLPDSFWKNFCIAIFAVLAVVLIVVLIWSAMRKADPVKLKDDPAIEVRKAPKRYNHDLAMQQFNDHERRILDLENWRFGLIEKLEDDKQEILKAGTERQNFLESKQEERHASNLKKIDRITMAIARICGRQNIPMPKEDEEI